jgi:hypothetical protein
MGDERTIPIYREKLRLLIAQKDAIEELSKVTRFFQDAEMPFGQQDLSNASKGQDTGGFFGDANIPFGQEDMSNASGKEDPDNWAQKALNVLSYAETVTSILSALDQASTDRENASLDRDTQINEKKKADLKRQLDAKRITQAQYNAQVEKLDLDLAKKQRKIQHDQAVRNKEIQLTNAIIGAAQMAISGFMTTPFMPLGLLMGAAALLLGGLQVGAIASAEVPAAASGRYNVIGQGDGRTYNDVPYSESFTGIPGRPMLVNETGNEIVIDPKTTRNLLVNYPDVIRAINFARVPQMASGAYGAVSTLASSSSGQVVVVMDPKYMAGLDRLNDNIENGLQANLSYDEFIRVEDKINRIKKDASR